MRTLELALKAETKKQRYLRIKLYADVWMQATLFAFSLVSLFNYVEIAFCTHFFALGFYQVISSLTHPVGQGLIEARNGYDHWLTVHMLAFVPCMVFFPVMFVFMITSTYMALWYFYITLCEFNALK